MVAANETARVPYDVVVIGGGPAGLSAALALGRARKRILLCDSGPRRNAAAEHVHNFVTQDGTPPEEFRRIGRQQLVQYPKVEVRDTPVGGISGGRGEFQVELGRELVAARRILLCTGMIDEMLPIEGFRELWGRAIFQCPYCHGWEVQERRWGYLALPSAASHLVRFVLQARGWSPEVVVFTGGAFEISAEDRARLESARVKVETAPVARLVARDGGLTSVELANGATVPCDVLYVHPPQTQVALVRELGIELDEEGYVRVDPMDQQTSRPGVYAAGDLATRMQGAIFAAAAGTRAAAAINAELTAELAVAGVL